MIKKILPTAVIAPSAATALANDYIEHRIYSDKNFEQDRAKAVRTLKGRGYHVRDVGANDFRGQPVLEVETSRNGREYDIILPCPDLRIVGERIDY